MRSKMRSAVAGTLETIVDDGEAIVDLQVRVGTAPLRARITRQSLVKLRLAEGQAIYALIKAVSFDRRSGGYA